MHHKNDWLQGLCTYFMCLYISSYLLCHAQKLKNFLAVYSLHTFVFMYDCVNFRKCIQEQWEQKHVCVCVCVSIPVCLHTSMKSILIIFYALFLPNGSYCPLQRVKAVLETNLLEHACVHTHNQQYSLRQRRFQVYLVTCLCMGDCSRQTTQPKKRCLTMESETTQFRPKYNVSMS